MSAWEDYGLDDLVIESLAKQRFAHPTPIQHECLPAAVLGNADIVGAAQTVRRQTFAPTVPNDAMLENAKSHELQSGSARLSPAVARQLPLKQS